MLKAALNELRPRPNFGSIIPWEHQQAIFLILMELQRFMLHVDMGGGKTLISLMLLMYRKQRGEKPKAIVFVPYITSVSTWIDEVADRCPTLKCVPLLGTGSENRRLLAESNGDLFVICYQSAVAMVSETVTIKKGKKAGKAKWQLKASQVREYFADFDTIIMDEIHKAKSVSSLTYRMCRAISAQCDWALGLTGTPFNKDLADLWPQFYLVDFGDTLGGTFGFYRDAFFEQKQNYWGGYEYKFKKSMLPLLQKIIKNCSISYDINELHDMPPRKYVVRQIRPNVGQHGYAEAYKKKIQDAIKNSSTALREVESNYLRLRQLSSGYMTLTGEDSNKVHIKFDDNPKLDDLIDTIEAMPAGRKMVVFHHFVYTNKLISERLTELKIGHARVWSGAKDPLGELKRFKQSSKCPILVINWKSGSSSLNLQFANYFYAFEQPDSAIDRQQGERRIWRPGQQHRVVIYDPFVRGTYDEAMNRSNKAGENLLKKLLRGKA